METQLTNEEKEKKISDEINKYKKYQINWLSNDFWDSWKKIKGHTINLLNSSEDIEWFFLAHNKDCIKGKPQIISDVRKTISLIRKFIKSDKKLGDITYYKFLDESYDLRSSGLQRDSFTLDFWIYRVISEGIEYFIFSQKELPNCPCNFNGMLINVNDFAEINRSLKLNSMSKIFILKDYEPDLKILSKKELINFTKSRKISLDDWFNFLAYNKLKNYNRFPSDIENLKSAFILSGKTDGYPLHWFIMGKAGTKKTSGYAETLAYKFDEVMNICEGGNSRMKGLIPSFKDKPAKIGYLAEVDRIGFVDEIGKMIQKASEISHEEVTNSLGDINFLLEHKNRKVKSGNEDVDIQATAKFIFITNPLSNKQNIYQHINTIDPSTLSRFLIWVQDQEEMEYAYSEKSIEKNPRNAEKLPKISREDFLNLFDSCYNFLCEIDESEVNRLFSISVSLAKEDMKTSIWKPRGLHHIKLLIDGFCKQRCLFQDYDESFKANQKDYEMTERILIRMINGWDTNLSSSKPNWTGSF